MSNKITTKRTSKVTFVGICNLPSEKALKLRDILQDIIAQLSALHASCDDAKIQVDERFKKVKDLASLKAHLHTLLSIVQDQVQLCSSSLGESNHGVKEEMQSIHSQIEGNTSELLTLFKDVDNAAGSFQIVDRLLNEVKLTVELLRAADRYTINRVEQMTNEVATLAEGVVAAKDMPSLVERAGPLTRAALEIARLAEQRAIALDHNNAVKEVKESLHNSSVSVGTLTPQVIISVKEAISSSRPVETSSLNNLKQALKDIAHAARVSPEFAVIFDVDYLDTELGRKLAALADAVRAGDRIGVSSNAKAVDKEIERRIALAKKDPRLDPQVQEATRAAAAQAQSAARTALEARLANPDPHHGAYMTADATMSAEFTKLKQTAAELPDHVPSIARATTQIPLIMAARALSIELWGLLQK